MKIKLFITIFALFGLLWIPDALAQRVLQCSPGTATVRNNLQVGITTDVGNLRVTGDAYIDGRVGVGTTSPVAGTKMTIESPTANAMISFARSGTEIGLIGANTANQINIQGNNQPIRFSTDGFTTEHMRIATDGNVGIGTPSPGARLELKRPGANVNMKLVNDEAGNGPGNTLELAQGYNSYLTATQGMFFGVAGGAITHSMLANGNVGIGTVAPTQGKLVVDGGSSFYTGEYIVGNSAAAVQLALDNNSAGASQWNLLSYGSNDAALVGKFSIHQEGAGDRLTINASGNVGIGTTTPGAKLEVNGQIKITGGTPALGSVLTSDAAGLASWQAAASGLPPATTAGQTLRANGTSWIANSALFNNGTNVGIGTADPQEQLHINALSPGLYIQSDPTGSAKIRLAFDSTFTRQSIILAATEGVSGTNLQLYTKPNSAAPVAERMRILSGGNVGIGTIIPAAKLDIQNPSGTALGIAERVQNLNNAASNNGLLVNIARSWPNTDAYALDAQSGGSSRLYVRSDGFVGIGTTNPGATLDVSGGSGTLRIGAMAQQSLGVNGYIQIGSLIIQWGEESFFHDIAGNYATTVNFPIPFPNGIYQVIASLKTNTTNELDSSISARVLSNSQVELRIEEWSAVWNQLKGAYIAIGY